MLATVLVLAAAPPARAQDAAAAIPAQVIDHIFLPAQVNGKAATLLLDPVEGVMLDRGFVARQGIPSVGGVEAGFGGPVRVGGAGAAEHEVTFVRRPEVSVGGRRLDVPLAPVIPLDSTMAMALGRRVDGLIGLDAFGDGVVELDFDAPAVRLHRRDGYVPPAGGVTVAMRLLAGKPIVETTIATADGRRLPASMVLDLGMGGTIRLTTRFTDAHALVAAVGPSVADSSESGLGGGLRSVIGRLDSLAIGGLVVRGPIVSLARETAGGDAAPPYDGLIGLGVLRRYRVLLDRRGGTVTFVPTARAGRPFVHAPAGVRFAPLTSAAPGGLVVSRVAPGTPAAAAGLEPGDSVVAVGGRPATAWTKRDWQDAIDASGGRSVEVVVRRGGAQVALGLTVPPGVPGR